MTESPHPSRALQIGEGATLMLGSRETFARSSSFFDPDGHGWQVMWMNPDEDAH